MTRFRGRFLGLVGATFSVAFILFTTQVTWARTQQKGLPLCSDGVKDLPVVNDQVLVWKTTTPNQFKARARVRGLVTRVFNDKPTHDHFEIKIGSKPKDVLEVIYNRAFGALPNIETKMDVEACGVYITSTAQAGPYPPSPSGAIIHWVHINPKDKGEPSGYLTINGEVYGDELPREGRKPPRPRNYGVADFFVMPFVK